MGTEELEGDRGGQSVEGHAEGDSVSRRKDDESSSVWVHADCFPSAFSVSRADMLRYLLLLLEGGTWR